MEVIVNILEIIGGLIGILAILAQIAEVLGKSDDSAAYQQLFARIKASFNKKINYWIKCDNLLNYCYS